MKRLPIILVLFAAAHSGMAEANSDPAKFWISASNANPISQEAPTINAAIGQERMLYIWAQPPTDENGDFRTLQSVSLNLVIPPQAGAVDPNVDFVDGIGKIKVYNPTVNGQPRFQYVFDSIPVAPYFETVTSNATYNQVAINNLADGVGVQFESGHDISGYSINTALYAGITPNPSGGCYATDLCALTNLNRPAWLVAEVTFKTIEAGISNPYYLQIGYSGMTHQEGATSVSSHVVFGSDGGSTYNAAQISHRQTTLTDTYDVQIVGIDPVPGDYDGNGSVGPEDYTFWKTSFGQSITSGQGADGSNSASVDAGDYVFWRMRTTSEPPSSSAMNVGAQFAVPEPASGVLALALLLLILSCQSRAVRIAAPAQYSATTR